MRQKNLEALQRKLEVLATRDSSRRIAAPPDQPVVTLSRAAGAGAEALARALAGALALPLYDREILDAVAAESGWNPELLERLDESLAGLKGGWLRTILTGEDVFPASYRRNLVNAILAISVGGGVIVGRGANFVLTDRPGLRLRLVGARPQRIERFAMEAGLSLDEAGEQLDRLDADRAAFTKRLFGREIDDPHGYDLVVNTDRLRSDRILRLVVAATHAIGR